MRRSLVDADDNESYVRGCGMSSQHNDEEDKCESSDMWGVDRHECVCDEDECNGGSILQASAVLAVSAVLRQLVL